jgi:site-specific DNA-methyltransferase (adenine-specific)
MSILLHGDCLEELKSIDDNSVDFIFCDLPYGQTSCKWDTIIPWEPFWKEIMRVKKINTPLFFTTTTKFGVELINNAPKKCPFRYDLVWVKSAPAGFLSAKKMPMRKHEMVYCFYEKLPFYDLSSHKHKFIKEAIVNDNNVKEITSQNNYHNQKVHHYTDENGKRLKEDCQGSKYDPPLPNTLLEIKSTRGKHSTEKPVALMEWLLKYFSKEGDTVLDPTMGSGSTGVACKNMNRNFIGIEKDPEIYEVAVNRIENEK